ncbi:hypothetical protein RP20_CCG000280 [Aedes albopictus]|nr:hypothetical protein RP20_CCG000280 [Aedes albopictus]
MASCSHFIALLLFAVITTGEIVRHESVPDAIADIIIHFANLDPLTFDCWFLGTDLEPLLGSIVSSTRIAHIPKVLVNSSTFGMDPGLNYFRKPSMVVLCVNTYITEPVGIVMAMYKSLMVDHDTKYLALIEFFNINEVELAYNMMFAKLGWNIVFVHTQMRLALVYNPFKKTFIYSAEMDLGIMFVDMTSNLYGTQVRFTLIGSTPWCALRQPRVVNGLVQGSIGYWVTETVRHFNGSWYGVQLFCNPAVQDCTQKYIFDEDGTPFDLLLTAIYIRKFLITTVDITEPVRLIILAPRGRMLKMFELFTYPFETELWTLITLLIIASALATTMFPTLFQNDPFMLAICGFERYQLRLARSHEKIILFSLIVLFFFITSAYENKFISLMTSYPRVRDPKTLADLRRAGIKVSAAVSQYATLETQFTDPELRSLIQMVDDVMLRPKTMAMMAEERMSRVILYGDEYLDDETGDVLFTPLKGYSVNLRVNSIASVPKSPYRTILRESERKFYDTGLMLHWFEELLYENTEFRRAYELSKITLQLDKDIAVTELLPVWIVLACGWSASCGVLVLEMMWCKWTNRELKSFRSETM